jgi:hypothetical protein
VRTVNVELTPTGGRYYRARTFWFLITAILLLPIFTVVVFAILNPFWFRENFALWLNNTVDQFVKWRSYQQYKIYLGMDPKVWHTLKD